jgi:hypothetical protein
VLRPNGHLIVSTPNQWPLKDTPFHVREYDRNSFVTVLATHFDCLATLQSKFRLGNAAQHGQARGVVPTTSENEGLAECFIALCKENHETAIGKKKS